MSSLIFAPALPGSSLETLPVQSGDKPACQCQIKFVLASKLSRHNQNKIHQQQN